MLTNVPAMAHILIGSFAFAGLFAFVAGSPFVYITYFEVPPQHYGYLVGLNALVMIVMNVVNARLLADRRPSGKAVAGAALIGVVGVALLFANGLGAGLVWIVVCVVAYMGMLGLVSALSRPMRLRARSPMSPRTAEPARPFTAFSISGSAHCPA